MDRQELVFRALATVYGTTDYADGVNRWLAPRIVKIIDQPREPGQEFYEVHNLIWVNWPGGLTAARAAERVMAALDDTRDV